MVSRHSYRGITWIDLESPTPGEVRAVMDEFSVHPVIGEELLVPSFRQKVDRFDTCIYLILHFPSFGSRLAGTTQEVDFVLGKDFIVTTRYGTMDPFLRFSKIFEAHSLLDRKEVSAHASVVFFYMLRTLYQALDGELESLSNDLSKIEERIFKGEERAMVFELSRISRALLTFRQSLTPHKTMLDSLEPIGVRFFGQDFLAHLKGVTNDYLRISGSLAEERDALLELRETNNSLLTTKQNEITKILTIMAFVTFPLTLISSIFGMNTSYLPIVGMRGDFLIITGLMVALAISFFMYFRHKRWL